MGLKLWKISRKPDDERYGSYDYDTYISAVVVAETEDQARMIHPNAVEKVSEIWNKELYEWTTSDNVIIEEMGDVTNSKYKIGDVIIADFNAG